MILQPNQKIWLLATLITATSGKQLAAFYNTPNLQPRAQGYQPCLNFCGIGSSCSEACGDDYTTCPSSDSILHCFNPSASQICCPGGTGNVCDATYYCAQDPNGKIFCCPDGSDLSTCASLLRASSLQSATSTPSLKTTTVTATETATISITLSSSRTSNTVLPSSGALTWIGNHSGNGSNGSFIQVNGNGESGRRLRYEVLEMVFVGLVAWMVCS
jgi:hypothetical protein